MKNKLITCNNIKLRRNKPIIVCSTSKFICNTSTPKASPCIASNSIKVPLISRTISVNHFPSNRPIFIPIAIKVIIPRSYRTTSVSANSHNSISPIGGNGDSPRVSARCCWSIRDHYVYTCFSCKCSWAREPI